MTDLAGHADRPAVDPAVEHQAGGEPGADAEVGEARRRCHAEERGGAERAGVDVVLDVNRAADAARQVAAERCRRVDAEVESVPHRAVGDVDPARDPDGDDDPDRDATVRIAVGRDTVEHLSDEPGDGVHHRRRPARRRHRATPEQAVRSVERRDAGAGRADVDADRRHRDITGHGAR